MGERREPGQFAPAPFGVVAGAAVISGAAGAIFGYLITGTPRGALQGALGIAFFGGKNAVISVFNPSFLTALAIGTAGGLAGLVSIRKSRCRAAWMDRRYRRGRDRSGRGAPMVVAEAPGTGLPSWAVRQFTAT
jgi:hypothetical protein